jgi:two-component system, LytTR family, sensor kinase
VQGGADRARRSDPDRARELILEFADFTRYSFRAAGQYTTLADELRNIDRYLTLERARFGDALKVRLQVAPEVLNVVVPFLALQPLVENAVRHGFSGQGGGEIEIIARDEGSDCVITVEDDGVGMDPDALRTGHGDALADDEADKKDSAHVGLTNVDHRLRAAFGNDYGLVVETAIGAGTKVVMRVPKFRAGVRA